MVVLTSLLRGTQLTTLAYFRTCTNGSLQSLSGRWFATGAKTRGKIPQKPVNAYIQFYTEKRPHLQSANPGVSVAGISRMAGMLWRNAPDTEKERYNSAFREQMEQYKEAFSKLSEEEKEAISKERSDRRERLKKRREAATKRKLNLEFERPKKPPGAYFLYTEGRRNAYPDLPIKEASRSIAQDWKQLSAAEKTPYLNEARTEMQHYLKTLTAWEARMKEEGHLEVVRARSKPRVRVTSTKAAKKTTKKGADEKKTTAGASGTKSKKATTTKK